MPERRKRGRWEGGFGRLEVEGGCVLGGILLCRVRTLRDCRHSQLISLSPFHFFFKGAEELIWKPAVRDEIDNSGDLYEFLDAYC